jgi:16S rRNA (guanine966-N2)-methyltransferase
MRIIGGRLSGRRFDAPAGRDTRPTSDRVREALASALESRGAFDGARVLDLFAGSGALSFEALSRGAATAVMVDRDPRVIRQLRRSASELDLAAKVDAVRLDLLDEPSSVVRRIPEAVGGFDLVFADAPYAMTDAVRGLLEELAAQKRIAPQAWVVVEHAAARAWVWPNGLASEAEYRYGQTRISLGLNVPEKGM